MLNFRGWVFEKDAISRRISKRIGMITMLDTTERNVLSSSESYQVCIFVFSQNVNAYFLKTFE